MFIKDDILTGLQSLIDKYQCERDYSGNMDDVNDKFIKISVSFHVNEKRVEYTHKIIRYDESHIIQITMKNNGHIRVVMPKKLPSETGVKDLINMVEDFIKD